MAMAERLLAARFGRSLVDHRTWVIASDGDMMEGISHEAAALAGHLCLSKLTVLYDDNHISIDGDTALCLLGRRAEALLRLWLGGASGSTGMIRSRSMRRCPSRMRSKKPTLIACRTIIGLGAPTKAGTAATHGSPLGAQEAAAAKAALGWHEPPFTVPDDLLERWRAVGSRGAGRPPRLAQAAGAQRMRGEFERVMAGRLPDNWHEAVAALKQEIADTKPQAWPPASPARRRWKRWCRRPRSWSAARPT